MRPNLKKHYIVSNLVLYYRRNGEVKKHWRLEVSLLSLLVLGTDVAIRRELPTRDTSEEQLFRKFGRDLVLD